MVDAIDYDITTCRLGLLLAATDAHGVCAVFPGQRQQTLVAELQRRFPAALIRHSPARLQDTLAAITGLIEQPAGNPDLPLSLYGTAFQQQVWQALRTVKPGATISYSELAQYIGKPKAVRAVAAACAANPVAILLPCHRVIGKNGRLTGYHWGLARKKTLLAQEAACCRQTES